MNISAESIAKVYEYNQSASEHEQITIEMQQELDDLFNNPPSWCTVNLSDEGEHAHV